MKKSYDNDGSDGDDGDSDSDDDSMDDYVCLRRQWRS